MTHQLTQKEQSLLKDQMSHEEICIKKYSGYAQLTKSKELRNLFYELAQEEQHHYDILNQYLGNQGAGQQMGSGQQASQQGQNLEKQGLSFETGSIGSQTSGQQMDRFQNQQTQTGAADDQAFCQDMLMTEKFMSNTYDTTVFESANPQLRKDMQKIQDEEQEHGEKVFNYMQKHGYYNPQ